MPPAWPRGSKPTLVITDEMITDRPSVIDQIQRRRGMGVPVADKTWDTDTLAALQSRWSTSFPFVATDLSISVRTWLFGDFDPRDLHRRDGWSLRRYRGEHRQNGGRFTPDDLRRYVEAADESRRRAHQRSLRRTWRPLGNGWIDIGTRYSKITLFTEPSGGEQIATLTITPDEGLQTVPYLIGPPAAPMVADEADTGPILIPRTPEQDHRDRTARIVRAYRDVLSEFELKDPNHA